MMKRRVIPVMWVTCALMAAPVLAQSAKPSFDCAKAAGEVEKLVCQDEALAALDRKLAAAFEKASQTWPAGEAAKQKAVQRGWIKGRDDCWKERDLRACVETSYKTRLVEVQIQSGQLMAPRAVGFACTGGPEKPFFATFYNDTDPPSAVLTFGDDQVIAFIAPAASGARYTAANVEFWEHQGVARVDWFGAKLECRPRTP